MPYPTQVTYDQLIETAWELVERDGLDQLSLARLAAQFNIKAPSLYKHIKNKAALIRAVNAYTLERLFAQLYDAIEDNTQPQAQLMAMATAFRAFAHAYPTTYTLAFSTVEPNQRPDPAEQEQAVLPLQACVAALTGDADSLPALRGLLALIHGYCMLELNAQLQRGGDLSATYEQVVRRYLAGWHPD